MATAADNKNKRVLVFGANEVGKSYVLNRLLNKENQFFPSGTGGNLVTQEINEGVSELETETGVFNLIAFDTPGNYLNVFEAFFFSFKCLSQAFLNCEN